MKINKSLDIDLNIISPQRNIQIHEGDIDSIDIVLAVSVDDVSLDLTGLTIKYDATINNYLAEQDADGTVVENKIVIPVTENMTAMPGLLLIDVRMIQGDEVLFTQTISAIVDKAVVNGSTYIDFSKITINQRLNALEEQMTYVEELVDGLDTSKQITSNRRPPQTAPATVDVDFFRVGDTWILQGDNIVYKLVEAEYNYQPDPEVPAVHKFTWQPLNERFNFGATEPPTSATYTPIEYTIGELSFSALPVPQFFKGDTYAQLVSGTVKTLFTLTDSEEVSSGQYSFSWHENGGGDTDNKMDLAPLNPTAEEIAAMPSGQIYDESDDGVVTIKGGTELLGVLTAQFPPEWGGIKGKVGQIARHGDSLYQCYGQIDQDTYVWKLMSYAGSDVIKARATTTGPADDYIISSSMTLQEVWELFTEYHCVKVALTYQDGTPTGQVCWITNVTGNNHEKLSAFMLPARSSSSSPVAPVYQRVHFLEQNASLPTNTLRLVTKYVYPPYEEYYTKTETNTLLDDKMNLAPLNPTAEEIEAMPSGQLYGDTVNHKGVIKDRQEFYDSTIAVRVFENNDGQDPPSQTISSTRVYNRGDYWINLSYENGERVCTALYICKSVWLASNSNWQYRWLCLYGANSEYYTKTEIDSMIGDIETALSEV